MNLVERILLIAIFAIFALLIAAAATAYRSMTVSVKTTWWIVRTHEVLEELQITLLTLKDIETSTRGYVITGDQTYLEPYDAALTVIDRHVTHLKRLTVTGARQQERIAEAESLISQKLALASRIIRLRAERGFPAAQRLIAMDEGERHTSLLSQVFMDMVDTENRHLRSRVMHANSSKEWAVATTTVALPLIFIQLVLVFLLIRRHLAGRAATEATLQALLNHDELTGLFNRRLANVRLKEEMARARRYQHALALILLDIDHFKTVNDVHGHPTGDKVLRWVAEHLRATVRNTDTPARFGGEEFAVILPETSLQDAFALAERIRRAVAAEPFAPPNGHKAARRVPITLSAGVAEFAGDNGRDETEESLITAADRALYLAKRHGRNRTASLTPALDSQLPLSLLN